MLRWTGITRQLFTEFPRELLAMYEAGQLGNVITLLTRRAQMAFCSINQYIDISAANTTALRDVYQQLVDDIARAIRQGRVHFDTLASAHGERLKQWLWKTNPMAASAGEAAGPRLTPVVCAEYSASLQLEVLQLELHSLKEPVLDLGCGPQAHMVRYLRSLGIEAFGVDRFIASQETFLRTGDWLDFHLPQQYYGTVVSNLSFSNHFVYHHLRDNEDSRRYAGKYMEILHALQPRGSYHYAPALPMIEQYLSAAHYRVNSYQVTPDFMSSVITRL
ncbi:MAG TPA: class I SAM-dependent methyltransferase [Chitinophaga sp.]|uniref:class I SAM-dependent methyltransferase n=1 Tax=Chitinophaga sp. TaxID=1869181 RepID=UPI002C71225A|nr:class I SAM-dependent methyltransferase [Chitinophaga sp.]HVI43450.1 class I SAM-dependent methyltransferase [Chitinophaga sp.]